MSTLTAAGWIVANDIVVCGKGETRDDAIADFAWDLGYRTVDEMFQGQSLTIVSGPEYGRTYAVPATEKLLNQIDQEGGFIKWAIRDGIACTLTENAV
jgi:hypothetical protein